MKKMAAILCNLLMIGMSLRAAEIVRHGKSEYTICYAAQRFLAAATLLQNCMLKATGCKMPVQENSSGPAIRIGQAPENANTAAMKIYEHHIEKQGQDIFLYGFDGRVCGDKGILLGSSNKAVTTFCE